jgi:hypothetical protein
MIVQLDLDGSFTEIQRKELMGLVLDWKMSFFPFKDDYFDLSNFTDKLPDFCNKGLWLVLSREFIDENTMSLSLLYEDPYN